VTASLILRKLGSFESLYSLDVRFSESRRGFSVISSQLRIHMIVVLPTRLGEFCEWRLFVRSS